jgi:hypothetical protein
MSLSAFELAMQQSAAESFARQAGYLNKLMAEPAFTRMLREAGRFQTSGALRDLPKIAGLDPVRWAKLDFGSIVQEATRMNEIMKSPGMLDVFATSRENAIRLSALYTPLLRMTFPTLAAGEFLRQYATSLPGAARVAEAYVEEQLADAEIDIREQDGISRKQLLIAAALNEVVRQLLIILADALQNEQMGRAGNALALVSALLVLAAAIREDER